MTVSRDSFSDSCGWEASTTQLALNSGQSLNSRQACKRDICICLFTTSDSNSEARISSPKRLVMSSSSVIRLVTRPSITACLRPAFRPIRRAPLPALAVQAGCGKSAFSTTSVKKSQPGHEEETFEEFSARYVSFGQLDKASLGQPGTVGRITRLLQKEAVRRWNMARRDAYIWCEQIRERI